MRARLVLLLAAAVVFAPGWGDGEALWGSNTASDLAGRVLAPTFDEASVERVRKPALVDGSKFRTFSNKVVVDVANSPDSDPRIRFVLTTVVGVAAIATRRVATFRPQRAPPSLLTV